jgi:hypothetical protein
VWNPEVLATHDLDRMYGRAGRLALQEDGNLVVYSSTNEVLWTSRTEGRPIAALMIQDAGRLVLKTDEGVIPWATERPPARWDGWNHVTDGRSLRRGQRLRNGSLVSDDGEYSFVVGEDGAAYLCRTDGEILWAVATGGKDGYELTLDGRLIARSTDGLERPADSLTVSGPTAAALAELDAQAMLVTDDGRLVIVDGEGAVIWAMEPPFLNAPSPLVPRSRQPAPDIPPNVPPLPAGEDLLVIRTDFSDDAAWDDAVARAGAEYDWSGGDPGLSIDVTPIDDRRYENLTHEQLAALVPQDVDWPMLAVADALTMASPRRHMLLVNLDEESLGPTARATPAAIVEMAINLWMANMDWEDFVGDPDYGTYDPDQVLESSEIPEPE